MLIAIFYNNDDNKKGNLQHTDTSDHVVLSVVRYLPQNRFFELSLFISSASVPSFPWSGGMSCCDIAEVNWVEV